VVTEELDDRHSSSVGAITGALVRRILGGEYPHGEWLPAEAALATEFGVSRSTVRRALERIGRQGLATAQRGNGWLVRSALHGNDLERVRSFSEWARGRGLEPGGRVLDQVTALPSAREQQLLFVGSRSPVLRVTRVRTLGERRVMLERTAYAPWVAELIRAFPADEPSVETALRERHGIPTSHARYEIEAVSAGVEDARVLDVRRSSPLLRMLRTTYARDGRPIGSSDDRFRPGIMVLEARSTSTPAS